MNDQALVSVVMPFLNAERTLLAAVKSVFAQTWTNWELILGDDGSTDTSLAIARAIDDPRVRVISDGKNLGHADRRNVLTGLARGDFIALLDSDDLMHHERLERQLKEFRERPELEVVATGFASVSPDFEVKGVRGTQPFDPRPATLLTGGGFLHPTVMGRREWFQKNPYRRGYRVGEDRELFLRTLATTCFTKINEPLYFYMEYGAQGIEKITSWYRAERIFLWEYGPRHIGLRKSAVRWSVFLAKTIAARLLWLTGNLDYLARRRITTETEKFDLGELQAEVNRILAISVPS